MDLQSNASFSSYIAYWNAIVAFSEQCEAKLVHGVLLLYLVFSSALAIGSCKSEKRAVAVQQQLAMDFVSFLATITVDHFPLFAQCTL